MNDYDLMREYIRKTKEANGWSNPPSPKSKSKPKSTEKIKEGTLAAVPSDQRYRVIAMFNNSTSIAPKLDIKSHEFFLSMLKKYDDRGTDMFVSEKQLKYLLSIATRNKF